MSENTAYTPEEVARLLKISKYTVYEMIKRGDLAAYTIGRSKRIEGDELERYIRRSKGERREGAGAFAAVPVLSNGEGEGLVLCGQDPLLDVLTRHVQRQLPGVSCLRSFSGSIEGLLSLYRGQVNLATTHLWDGDADSYNEPYVRRLLPGQRVVIVHLAERCAGFYVARGNPLGLQGWKDLHRTGLRLVNREAGAGARVLLDERLRLLGIDPETIEGYGDEVLSHYAVASAVASGDADVGLGIEKVALQVPDIDFIPLQIERYDLVLRQRDLKRPLFQTVLQILRSPEFQREIAGMGGYGVKDMGKIVAQL